MKIPIELFAELTAEIMRDNLVLEGVRSHISHQLKSIFRVLWINFCILAVKSWYLEADAKIIHEFLFVFSSCSCDLSLVEDAGFV